MTLGSARQVDEFAIGKRHDDEFRAERVGGKPDTSVEESEVGVLNRPSIMYSIITCRLGFLYCAFLISERLDTRIHTSYHFSAKNITVLPVLQTNYYKMEQEYEDLPKVQLVSRIFFAATPVGSLYQLFLLIFQIPGGTETSATFVINHEDHTIGNSLRYMIMRE